MSTCRICDFARTDLVAENDEAFAFFVREPARPGHMAVAPRAHRLLLAEMTESEAAAVMRLARSLTAIATPVLEAEKFYLAAIADLDRHFHVHLIPKRQEDASLGPFLFSPDGWQGGRPADRDERLERAIRARIAHPPLAPR